VASSQKARRPAARGRAAARSSPAAARLHPPPTRRPTSRARVGRVGRSEGNEREREREREERERRGCKAGFRATGRAVREGEGETRCCSSSDDARPPGRPAQSRSSSANKPVEHQTVLRLLCFRLTPSHACSGPGTSKDAQERLPLLSLELFVHVIAAHGRRPSRPGTRSTRRRRCRPRRPRPRRSRARPWP
jgi:hypothetical protein